MRSSPSAPDPLDPGPAGFAHRGLHHGSAFPENSLVAFAAALEFGAGIECDLRLTADGEILVFHDADAWRMCASPMRIGCSTRIELDRLRVGFLTASWDAIDNKSGASARMRASVKRTVGPAIVMTPIGFWPLNCTGAPIAFRPAVKVSCVKL